MTPGAIPHEITVCSCGTTLARCRCMGPHRVRVVEDGCEACRKAAWDRLIQSAKEAKR